MIEIEVINACLCPVVSNSKDSSRYALGIDSYCVLKSNTKEIARTELCRTTLEPIWNEKFVKPIHELSNKEKIYNRPFYLEYLDVEVYEAPSYSNSLTGASSKAPSSTENTKQHVKIFESRVPLCTIGYFKSYRLISTTGAGNGTGSATWSAMDGPGGGESRIFIRISPPLEDSGVYSNISHFCHNQLCEEYPPHHPLFRHLYLDFDWSPWGLTYNWGLPGPRCGEELVDRYECVEVSHHSASSLTHSFTCLLACLLAC